ncbi:CGNR zinc finger domain-containing protein [Hoyosella altamirensis]|uniref:Putative RNA-binding Zn ribbon-like protein n=1 Tax=Hoyosella altamirensis TaxID=616997 RepID=A0A839RJV6_9ACTN|nr:ABATE domain-containing protein [Hoyosella altamirensis]MBB3036406.1 putative RNA-binding Zn ribbon-like protein [Hoyosella altamirensis]
MSAETVWTDDHFIAGDAALDFANTVYRRTPELGADLLNSVGSLTTWLHHAKLLPPPDAARDSVDDSASMLAEARHLRQLFWVIFDAQIDGRDMPTGALAGLFEHACRGLASDVAIGPHGATTPLTVHGGLTVLALQGIRLVLSPPSQPVRACDRCGWFYLDTSRSRRRRWCSMKTCGNQAKAARYRSAHP